MTRTIIFGFMVSLLSLAGASKAHAYSQGAPPTCSGAQQYYEARVYTNTNYGGTCYSLNLDVYVDSWASWDSTTGFPNDVIKSVKTGAAALVLFDKSFSQQDESAPKNIGANTNISDLGTAWRNKASAARLRTFVPGNCPYLNKVTLHRDANYGGDCTALTIGNSYSSPVLMGFHNNTLSSIKSQSESDPACLFNYANNSTLLLKVNAGASNPNLGTNDNKTSSVLISAYCDN